MCLYVYSASVCVFIFILSANCQLEEGASCMSQSDEIAGKCVNLRHCLSVVKDIKNKKHPQLCSFRGRDPIVCCTDCKLVNDTSNVLVDKYGHHYFKTGRRAIDKCLEYLVNIEYPCPMREGLQRQLDEKEDGSGTKCYSYSKPFIAAAVGGHDARRGEFPHMALLGYGDTLETAEWLCGGSVISDRFILTAAHCIASNAVGTVKYVALGILKRTDPPETWQRYNVKRTIRHPGHKPPSKYNDIALIEVDNKIKFSKDVLPACLNAGDNDDSAGIATGWGALGNRKALSDTLQVVYLSKFSDLECAGAYPPHRNLANGYDHSTQSCYGDKNEVIDTCEGDSGGPLQVVSNLGTCVYKIIGVTSYGRACGQLGGSGIYTKVEHYIPWIESVVWPTF